ncbi:allantoate amidohydrolase [Acidisphaera sp. L21]|uniref:allantoate amidohydrolase n=1 Tax=Acidisphaera sp. L21 TaxID=1641851 RepID=UPI00131C2BEB|nr:allantoate amidohydrolase [Acidisphaera sp. L21]
MSSPTIDAGRLWSDLMTLGQIGALPRGGCDRLALTDADRDGRALFAFWCQEAGLAVTVDGMGNMFARREGTDPSLPPVFAGSHLDTQSPGGRFDGPLGVLAALAAIRAIDAAGVAPARSIEVVNWTNEEGARFFPGLMGSAVFAGVLPLETAHAAADRSGRTAGEELVRIRANGSAALGGRPVDSYFELHIEQGPELEEAGITIGVVTHSNYSLYADIEWLGDNAHISSMPMLRRRNALVGAARMIAEIDRIGRARAANGAASATVIDIWPNNRINIPHRATFSYGLIHTDAEGLAQMAAEVEQAAGAVAAETGLEFRMLNNRKRDVVRFDPALTALVEQIATQSGHSVTRMRTKPGHDAFNMTRLCPTQLIFVPCRDGLSHNELEWCTPEHVEAGATVLLRAILARAT